MKRDTACRTRKGYRVLHILAALRIFSGLAAAFCLKLAVESIAKILKEGATEIFVIVIDIEMSLFVFVFWYNHKQFIRC